MTSMVNTMAQMNKMPGKTVTKKAAPPMPAKTGLKPGKSISSKAAPKTITKMARIDRLAANQPQTKGAVGGHMSYDGLNGRDKG